MATLYSAAALRALVVALECYEPGIAARIFDMVATRVVPIAVARHCLARSLLPIMPMQCCARTPVWEPLVVVCMANMPMMVFTDLRDHLPAAVGRAFGGKPFVLPTGKGIVVRDWRGMLVGCVKLRFISLNQIN